MTDTIVRNSAPSASVANLVSVIHEYSATRRVENVLHPKMNASGYNITFRPTRLRAGTLRLLFDTPAHAAAAVSVLTTPYTFTFTSDVPETSMVFAVAPGELDPQPQEDLDAWVVTVPFQEVTL